MDFDGLLNRSSLVVMLCAGVNAIMYRLDGLLNRSSLLLSIGRVQLSLVVIMFGGFASLRCMSVTRRAIVAFRSLLRE